MTFKRRRVEQRDERRAGIFLFLLGSAAFALGMEWLARIGALN
jgi:hypothetical protein